MKVLLNEGATKKVIKYVLLTTVTYMTFYYFGNYSYIIMSWSRTTTNYYLVNPLTNSILTDLLIIDAISVIIIWLSTAGRIWKLSLTISTVVASLVGYTAFTNTSVSTYLVLISLPGLTALLLTYLRHDLRKVLLNSVAIVLIVFSLVTITTSLLRIFNVISDSQAHYVILTYWRGFWRGFEIPLSLSLFVVGIYWLITYLVGFRPKYTRWVYELCRESRVSSEVGANSRLILVFATLFPTILVLLLHTPTFNPKLAPISVDTFYYARVLTRAHNLKSVILSFQLTRPLYMLVIYPAYLLVRNPIVLMDIIHPSIVLGLMVLATYRLARKYCPEVATLAALLTAIGPNILTFIAGGFQANSLALAIALLALSVDNVIIRYTLFFTVALIHPWTFVMYLAVDFLWRLRSNRKHMIRRLLPPVITGSVCLALLAIASYLVGVKGPTNYLLMLLVRGALKTHFIMSSLLGIEVMTWGSLLNPPLYALVIPTYVTTPAHLALATASPIAIISNKTIVERLVLNVPLGLIASQSLSRLSRPLRIALTLSILAFTLGNALALTPLTTLPWINIYNPFKH